MLTLSPAHAAETFTLSGPSKRLAPVELSVLDGAQLIECRGAPKPSMVRCLAFDRAREGALMYAYYGLIRAQGWKSVRPDDGARERLVMFQPTQSTKGCPPLIMVFPAGSTEYKPDTLPPDKVLFAISYAPDLLCMLGKKK